MHFFTQNESSHTTRSGESEPSDASRWRRVAILDGGLALSEVGEGEPAGLVPPGANAVVAPFLERGVQRVALVRGTRAGITVNGHHAPPVVVLRDRDEVGVGSTTFVFAEAEEAHVVPFEPAGSPTFCPRCSQELLAGDEIVRCPVCAAPQHEGLLAGAQCVEQFCWTLGPACGGCYEHRDSLVWDADEVLG